MLNLRGPTVLTGKFLRLLHFKNEVILESILAQSDNSGVGDEHKLRVFSDIIGSDEVASALSGGHHLDRV